MSEEANERWRQGEALRRARKKEGLSLFEKAAILGVDPIVLNNIEHGRRSAEELPKESSRRPAARADTDQSSSIKIDRDFVIKLNRLGPEVAVDGYELCPCCDGMSPGISIDGETIMHCPVCHDQGAVTVADAERGRDEIRKCMSSEQLGQPRVENKRVLSHRVKVQATAC